MQTKQTVSVRRNGRQGLTLRVGDLVKVPGYHRNWVVLPVSQRDVRRGVNAVQPGLHLFGGYWYAGQSLGGPLSHAPYGKMLAVEPHMQVRKVGRIRSHYGASARCR